MFSIIVLKILEKDINKQILRDLKKKKEKIIKFNYNKFINNIIFKIFSIIK